MTRTALRPLLSNPALRLILLIGIPIAALAPFDVLFSALTLSSPWLRMAWIAVLVVLGALAGAKLGLRLEGHSARAPVLVGLGAALAVAIYVVLLDCFVFRSLLDPGYAAFLHQPLQARLLYFMPRAFNENIMYRLFGFGGLAWLLSRGGRRPASPRVLAAAMIGSQLINIAFNVVLLSHVPVTALTLTYDALRYVLPGVLWAILYIRNGFATAEVASVGCHLFLQPAFSLLI
ncbi:MAG: hypothetical protein QFC78_11590 [Pseudomonadota bacterium]|nr:hypothetical protein [Pseudomonadota bacterium]